MAAGLIRVKRQTVCRTVTTLLKRNTTGRTFTHQFSQLALQQSWWKQRGRERESAEILKKAVGEESSQRREVLWAHTAGMLDNYMHTYGSCTRPLHQDSPGCRRSAEWRAGRDHSNIGSVQVDRHPAEERCRAPERNKTPRPTCRHSRAPRHTSSFLGYTERSADTGTGPQHRSEAGALLVLRRHIKDKYECRVKHTLNCPKLILVV